jgi:hypothetical protein
MLVFYRNTTRRHNLHRRENLTSRYIHINKQLAFRSSFPERQPGYKPLTTGIRFQAGPAQSSVHWVPCVLSPLVKRTGREADHSLPSGGVKNFSSPSYISPDVFIVRDSFSLPFLLMVHPPHTYSQANPTRLRAGDRCSRVRFPAGAGNYSLHHRVQNGSGVHPASYPMGTGGSFPGSKAAGA